MNIIEELCLRYDFHPDATAFLSAAYTKLEGYPEALAVFQQQVELYRQDYVIDHKPVFQQLHALEETTGIHQNTIDLMYLIRLFPMLQELYRQKQLPERYFYGFVNNIKHSQGGGKESYGTRIGWWFIDFYKLRLFTIGRLQFRYKRFTADTPCGDRVFPENSYYLDVHIPGEGPLLPESCEASYTEAAEFFRGLHEMPTVVFGCYSWLLSPDLDEILKPESNILTFAHRYTLAEAVPDTTHSHITFAFGVSGVEDFTQLPEHSSLQRALKQRLLEGKCLNLGKGYFVYDPA
jgi:hypothetical protein